MNAIRKIITLQGPGQRSKAQSSRDTSKILTEKRTPNSGQGFPEENQTQNFTPLNRLPSKDSGVLHRNKTLTNFVPKRSERSPRLLESAITPGEKSKMEGLNEMSVEKTRAQNSSKSKALLTTLPKKKITILTRKFVDKNAPSSSLAEPKTTTSATQAKIFPGFLERSTTSGTCEQRPNPENGATKQVSKSPFIVFGRRNGDGSLDRFKAKQGDNKQVGELRISKKPSMTEDKLSNVLADTGQITEKTTKEVRKPIMIPRNDKVDPEKSKSIDLIKRIFKKKSSEIQKPVGNRSEDKESNRFTSLSGPGMAWFKRPIVRTLPEEANTKRAPEIESNHYYQQLKKQLDASEESKKVVRVIRQAFSEKEAASQPDSEAFAFKTTSDFYKIKTRLGKGCFGEVYLATQVLTGCSVALKVIPKMTIKNKDSRKKIEKEVSFLQKTGSHEAIIQLFEVFEDASHVYLVFEYAPNGDLVRFFEKNPLFTEDELRPFYAKILRGVEHLHSCRIIHRDIKLDNILLDRNMEPKLCDFGISTAIEPGKRIYDTGGTPAYLAPEVIKSEGKICEKTDVWSLGVLLYLLSFGQVPFKANDMQVLYHKILSGKFQFKETDEVSSELMDLISKMLIVDLDKRISLPEIFAHSWLAGHGPLKKVQRRPAPERVTLLKSVIVSFLTDAGFSESYVSRSLESNQPNHVKACFDLLMDKFFK